MAKKLYEVDDSVKKGITNGTYVSSYQLLSKDNKRLFREAHGAKNPEANYAIWMFSKLYGDKAANKVKNHFKDAINSGTETAASSVSKITGMIQNGMTDIAFEDKFGDDVDYEQMVGAPAELKRRMLNDDSITSFSKDYLEGGIGEDWTKAKAKELLDSALDAYKFAPSYSKVIGQNVAYRNDYIRDAHEYARKQGVDLNYNRNEDYQKRNEKIAKIRTDMLDEAHQEEMSAFASEEVDNAYIDSKIKELSYNKEKKNEPYSKVIDTFGSEDEFTDIGSRNLYQAFKAYDNDIKNGMPKEAAIEKLDSYLVRRCEENQDWCDVIGDGFMSFYAGMAAGTIQLYSPLVALGYALTEDSKDTMSSVPGAVGEAAKGLDLIGRANMILATGKTADGKDLPAFVNNKYASDMMQYHSVNGDDIEKAKRNGMSVYQLLNSTGEINAAQVITDVAGVVGNMAPVVALSFAGSAGAAGYTARGIKAMAQGAAGAAKAAKYARYASNIGKITEATTMAGGYFQTIGGEITGVFDEYVERLNEQKQAAVGEMINERFNQLKEEKLDSLTEQIYNKLASENKDGLPDQVLVYNAQQMALEELQGIATNETMNREDVKKFMTLSEEEIVAFQTAAIQENALEAFKMFGMSPMLKYLYKAPKAFSQAKRMIKAAENAKPKQTIDAALRSVKKSALETRAEKIKDLLGEGIDEGLDNVISTYTLNNASTRSAYEYDKSNGELVAKFSGVMSVLDPGNVLQGVEHAFDNFTQNASGWYEAALGAFVPLVTHGVGKGASGIKAAWSRITGKPLNSVDTTTSSNAGQPQQATQPGSNAQPNQAGTQTNMQTPNGPSNGGLSDGSSPVSTDDGGGSQSNGNVSAEEGGGTQFTDDEKDTLAKLGFDVSTVEAGAQQQVSTDDAGNAQPSVSTDEANAQQPVSTEERLADRGFTMSYDYGNEDAASRDKFPANNVNMINKISRIIASISSALKNPCMMGNLLTTIMDDVESSQPVLEELFNNEDLKKQLQTTYGNTTMLDAIKSMMQETNEKVNEAKHRLGMIPQHCKTWVSNAIANVVADQYNLRQRGIQDFTTKGLKILGSSSKIMKELDGVAKRFASEGTSINSKINNALSQLKSLETIDDFDTVFNDFESYPTLQQATFLATATPEQYDKLVDKIGDDAASELLNDFEMFTDMMINNEVASSDDKELEEVADGLEALEQARAERSNMINLVNFAVDTIENFNNFDVASLSPEEKIAYYDGVRKSIDIIRSLEKHINKNDERYKEFKEMQDDIAKIEKAINEPSAISEKRSDNETPRVIDNDDVPSESISDDDGYPSESISDEAEPLTREEEQKQNANDVDVVPSAEGDYSEEKPSEEQKPTVNEVAVTSYNPNSTLSLMRSLGNKLKELNYNKAVSSKICVSLFQSASLNGFDVKVHSELIGESGEHGMIGYYRKVEELPEEIQKYILPEDQHDGKVFLGGSLIKPKNVSLGTGAIIKPRTENGDIVYNNYFNKKQHNKIRSLIENSHRFKEVKAENKEMSDEEVVKKCFDEMPKVNIKSGKIVEDFTKELDIPQDLINITGMGSRTNGVAICIKNPEGRYDLAIMSDELHDKNGVAKETPLGYGSGSPDNTIHWFTLDYEVDVTFSHEQTQAFTPESATEENQGEEKTINGDKGKYTLEHDITLEAYPNDSTNDGVTKNTGAQYDIVYDGNVIGSIYTDDESGDYISISSIGSAVEIQQEYRGKHFGTDAYIKLALEAKSRGKILRSATLSNVSNDAKRLWESLINKGFAKKAGDRYEFINSSLDNVSAPNTETNDEPKYDKAANNTNVTPEGANIVSGKTQEELDTEKAKNIDLKSKDDKEENEFNCEIEF